MSPENRLALLPRSKVRGDFHRARWAPLAAIGCTSLCCRHPSGAQTWAHWFGWDCGWVRTGLPPPHCLTLTPATQPGPGRSKKKDHGFKVSADGRLIIREEDDDSATAKMEEEEGTKGGTTAHSQGTPASGAGRATLAWSYIYSFVYLLIHSMTPCWGSVGKYR